MQLFGYEANMDLTITLRPDYKLLIRNPVKLDPRTGAQIDFDFILDEIHKREVGLPPSRPELRLAPERPSVIAEGVYPRGGWQSWVAQQGRIWIDRPGNIHLIEKMDKDYCLNVIQFLYENHRADIEPARDCPLIQALRKRVLS